jgi:polysaccharide export outer membrane protein
MQDIDLTDINAMKSLYYLQPNDYIYIKPLKQKSWDWRGIESLGTIIVVVFGNNYFFF